MNTLTEIYIFLKNPNAIQIDEISNKEKIFWRIFLIQFIVLLLHALVWLLMSALGVKIPVNNVRQAVFDFYGDYAYLFICVIGPVIEETLLRLPLKLQKKMLIVSSGIPFIYVLGRLFSDVNTGRIIGLLFLLLYFIFAISVSQSYLDYLKKMHYKKIIWGSIFIFTLLHLSNYGSFYFFNVIFLLPIFSAAIFITYLRCLLGFRYGIAFHILFNLMLMLL